jgi:hypothetical protein
MSHDSACAVLGATDLARVACLEEAGSAVENLYARQQSFPAAMKKLGIPMGTSAIVSEA